MHFGFAAWRRRRHVWSRPVLLMVLWACSTAQPVTYEGPPGAACDIDTLRDEFGVIRVTMKSTKVCFSLRPCLISSSLLPHSLSSLALILSRSRSFSLPGEQHAVCCGSLRRFLKVAQSGTQPWKLEVKTLSHTNTQAMVSSRWREGLLFRV